MAADIHQTLLGYADCGRAFAMALVIEDAGHTPRRAGTTALIAADGSIAGTIGGGLVEAQAQRCAVQAIRSGRPEVFEAVFEGASATDCEPICGGRMRVLVDPTAADRRAVYAQAVEALRRRQSGLLVTRASVRPDGPPEVSTQWLPAGTAAAPSPAFPPSDVLAACLASGKAASLNQEDLEAGTYQIAVVEPLAPPPLLVIAGGGHVGQAVARQAALVGFQIVILDDRPEFADAGLFPPGTTTRCGDVARELAGYRDAPGTYVVIVTRGHQHDQQALAACVGAPLAYLGMIGSRRKVALVRQALRESGAAGEADLACLYAPIGLDIGAETVPEIAASIVAQLISVRRKGTSPRMPMAPEAPP